MKAPSMGGVKVGSRTAPWLLALLLTLPGCGFEGDLPTPPTPPSPPVPPTQAGILLSLSASPIVAVPATPWSAEWTLTVRETSGIGGNIQLVRATLVDPAGTLLAQTELDAEQVKEQLGGSNHIGGGSNEDIAMSLGFDFSPDTPIGNLNVTVEMSDDRGNAVSAAVDDVVQICIPAQVTPEDAAVMDNGCTNRENGIAWDFDWDDCPGAESYSIHIDHPSLETPFDRDLTISQFSLLEDRVIPEESRIGWKWSVRANVNGIWGSYSPERTFDVERVNTDCVTP
jgi:hypothetical protein